MKDSDGLLHVAFIAQPLVSSCLELVLDAKGSKCHRLTKFETALESSFRR